jgi:pimeloyl-ACP methyl ester carboxylesterase
MRLQPWPTGIPAPRTQLPQPAAPVPSAKKPPDPEDLWNTHLADAADTVYSSDFTVRQWCASHQFSHYQFFDEGFSQAVGYVRDGVACLAFRGTQEAMDWAMDGLCLYWGSPPRHVGFQKGWANIRARVVTWLESLQSQYNNLPLSLAGHSLGGAVATIAALELAQRGFDVQRVVVFGSPRVGSPEFVARYAALGLQAKTRRFVHDQDGVSVLPPPLWYAHVTYATGLTQSAAYLPLITHPAGTAAPDQPVAKYALPLVTPTPAVDKPALFFTLLSMFPSLIGIAWTWRQLLISDPSNRWWNPEQTSLGKQSSTGGYVIFILVLVAARLLTGLDDSSAWLNKGIIGGAWFYWPAVIAFSVLVQQACYFLLYRFPGWLRLPVSVALAVVQWWWLPLTQISIIAAQVLVITTIFFLLVGYSFVGGAPDHRMKYYVAALKK